MQTIEFKVEKIKDLTEEMIPLLKDHYKEIALYQDKIEFSPNFEGYYALEDANQLKLFTCRDGDKLVGYFAVIVQGNLHYQDHLYATNDVVYLDKDYRGEGIGASLLQFAEDILKEDGVSVIQINTKVQHPFDELLEHLEYKCAERVYIKYIGEK